MRGAAISPSALCLRSSSARLVSLPTSRTVVMPHASQIFSSYSMRLRLAAALLLQVRVRVDEAGQHVLAGGVDHGVGLRRAARSAAAERHRVERDHVGDHVVLDDDVLRARWPACRCRRPRSRCGSAGGARACRWRSLREAGTSQNGGGEKRYPDSVHGNDCGMNRSPIYSLPSSASSTSSTTRGTI